MTAKNEITTLYEDLRYIQRKTPWAILSSLRSDKYYSVTELSENINIAFSEVSYSLKSLKEKNYVIVKIIGIFHYYKLTEKLAYQLDTIKKLSSLYDNVIKNVTNNSPTLSN